MPPAPGEQHLERLASSPRPTGSEAAAIGRAYCRDTLRELGFTVREHAFEYSAFPGRYAMPVLGAWITAIVSIAAGFALHGHLYIALAKVLAGYVLLAVVALWAGRRGVLGLPWLRTTGVNVEAVRSSTPPRVWLVAHLDSKWQPVSMLVRVAAISLLILVAIAALLLAVTDLWRAEVVWLWAPLLIATWLFGLPVIASIVGTHSNGAVDNASGVATVLRAASLLPASASVGVLITDAEELALAGAYAWSRGRSPRGEIFLNCDSVDDVGQATVMYHGREPDAAATALIEQARVQASRARIMRVPIGMLTDSVAFKKAGMPAATLSRGSIRTLWRIHSAADSLLHMKGTGIEETARVLAAAAMELVRQ